MNTAQPSRRRRVVLTVVTVSIVIASGFAAITVGGDASLTERIGVFILALLGGEAVLILIDLAVGGKTASSLSLPGGGGLQRPTGDQTDLVQQGLQEGEAGTKREETQEAMNSALKEQLKTTTEQLTRAAGENARLSEENMRLRALLDAQNKQDPGG